jgi:hypothetical protein
LAVFAILAYLPTLHQPFLEDDYSNIILAQQYGPVAHWPQMFSDPVFRLRATSWVFLYVLNRWAGMHAPAYFSAVILLHVLNTWLVFSLGTWPLLGYRLSAWAAGFFAVYEGHQEAVMWVSASSECLMVLFGLLSFLAWIRFLESRGWIWYASSFLCFCAALLSKESAVILAVLLVLPVAFRGTRAKRSAARSVPLLVWQCAPHPLRFYRTRLRNLVLLLPFAAASAIAAASLFLNRENSFRFRDGSFSLHAPFWITWPNSFVRLFWFWGLLSLIAILMWKPVRYKPILGFALSWTGIALIPYVFLTYANRIPSRQTYLASVGIAILVGFGLVNLYDRFWPSRPGLVVGVCVVMVAHNVIYLWTIKRAQFLARAAPTEQLIALARSTPGPIYVKCFPRTKLMAESAVQLMVGRTAEGLVWNDADARRQGAVVFCYERPSVIQ